ncbi:hypothetical protein QJQ45_010878 [Haematococcus lacustris]|nr:hypothetical protein QJQ45_010878 [Haematococcus lacustris]
MASAALSASQAMQEQQGSPQSLAPWPLHSTASTAAGRAADFKEAKLGVTTCITHSIQAEAVDAAAGTTTNGKTQPTTKHCTAISQPATNPTHAPHLAAVSGAKKPAVDASTAVNILAAQEGSETTDIMTASAGSSLSCEQLASSLQGVTYSTPSRAQPHCAPVEYQYVLGDITLTYGHSSFQGARDYQEDTVACVPLTSGLAGGVFDGHGGDDVSRELERVLLQSAIHHAYIDTNNEIGGRLDAAREAGSCAVTAFVTRVQGQPYLLCANAGDCRAVLFTQLPDGTRKAVRLSEDHKPQPHVCPSEITRINDAGGCVLWGRVQVTAASRGSQDQVRSGGLLSAAVVAVQGCLAVSRAFGDRTLQPFVIPDPHVLGRPLDPKADLFFYLASDGPALLLADMVDDALGCNVIAEQLQKGCNTTQASAALVSAAYQKGSCDNISVLLVRISQRQPGDKTGPVGERADCAHLLEPATPSQLTPSQRMDDGQSDPVRGSTGLRLHLEVYYLACPISNAPVKSLLQLLKHGAGRFMELPALLEHMSLHTLRTTLNSVDVHDFTLQLPKLRTAVRLEEVAAASARAPARAARKATAAACCVGGVVVNVGDHASQQRVAAAAAAGCSRVVPAGVPPPQPPLPQQPPPQQPPQQQGRSSWGTALEGQMLAPPIASPQGPIASPDLRHMYQLALAAIATQGQAAPAQGSEPGAAAPAPGFTLRKRTTPSKLGLPKTAAKRKRCSTRLS